jgi:CHAT domain-containing protein/Flp pilus assembly protein TadD
VQDQIVGSLNRVNDFFISSWHFYFGLAITIAVNATAQDNYYPELEKKALDAVNSGQYDSAVAWGKELYAAYPDNIVAHIVVGYGMINIGRYKDAGSYIGTSMAIDPTEVYSNLNTGLYYVVDGDLEKAKPFLTQSIRLLPPETKIADVLEEIRQVGVNLKMVSRFEEIARWYEQQYNSVSERFPTLSVARQAFYDQIPNGPAAVRIAADDFANRFYKMSWPEMALGVYAQAARILREYGHLSEAVQTAEAGYSLFVKNGYGDNPFQAGVLLQQLIDSYDAVGNNEAMVSYIDEVLALSPSLPVHTSDVNALLAGGNAYDRLGDNDTARKLAGEAWVLAAEKSTYRFGAVSAANSLCAAFNLYRYNTDVSNAIYYGEQALQMAQNYKFEYLLGSVVGNLALAHWKLGTREAQSRCIYLHGALSAAYEIKKMYAQQANILNNLGAIFLFSGMYAEAAENFEQSIRLAEKDIGSLSEDDKLTFYQSQVSAYQFLTVCYANLKNAEKTFDAMEGSRSRVLTERLAKGNTIPPARLVDLQTMLAPDEAAIMYDLFSAHEVTILVITKKYAQALFHTDETFVATIKAKYLDRMNKEHRERSGDPNEPVALERGLVKEDFDKVTQLTRRFFESPGMADEVLKEYLQGYYKFLILPIANRLSGIKNLLISPDDVLNYIPFEALTMHDGKYLIEKFGIRYLGSTGALKQISERVYNESRNPLLAMGGAVYQPLQVIAPHIQTQHDLNVLQVQVRENEAAGKSQLIPYAAMFGTDAMNALPGTLAEVKSIAGNVPAAVIYTGGDMTEERIKAMSASGALSSFRVVHLATHGFVVQEIPALSGIAMCIPGVERAGQDGFLNVKEISSLKLNADLTVLSACQTALGKIYSGEGVTGLTQSLLVAGSNAALVSLWPVNDTSTMLFMSSLYKEASKGKTYSQVVNDLKRRFIKGEFGDQFRHPNFWAPFIYVGK